MKETFSAIFQDCGARITGYGLIFFMFTGCILTPTAPQATSSLSSLVATVEAPTVSIPSTAKAVKIFFQGSPSSSFDLPSSNLLGTVAAVGSGLKPTRIYNADGSILASKGTTDPSWPPWLTSFEIGVSGSNNLSATNPHCANFVYSAENLSLPLCLPNSYPCGAPLNQFRVSEYDCTSADPGLGGPSDGIYFRAVFNRATTALGASENILVTIEYSASALNPAPVLPLKCFNGGVFTPELCSDFTWRAYLKHTPGELLQPFLVVVPPISSSPLQAGTGINTKQILLPIAADATLTTFQLSRTGSILTPATTNLSTYCLNGRAYGDSPLCAGMVFYSITFYRI